ncbi:hypothetical protein BH20ACT24_BH20ACT24_18230 [soil metagenome]
MKRWEGFLVLPAVVLAGALGTLAVAAVLGAEGGELSHLAVLLLPAGLATIVSTLVVAPLLARSSLRLRLVSISVISALVSLGNLVVLSRLMIVDERDAALVATLLLYSIGTGVGAALVLGRSSTAAVARLASTATALGEGDLEARTGTLDAGPELDQLGATLDQMAGRLQGAIDRERSAESRRRDLMTAVSHDLRTPLASLRAMVEAIDDGVVDDVPTVRRYAVEMRHAVDSLVLLVDDLFELAQLDAGAIEVETARARLEDVVLSAIATCETQAHEKRLSLQTRLNGVGGATCSPRLGRVVQNLLQNAIRHTPADGSVWIEARRSPSGLELAVQDTGEGIEPEALDRVFEPFWRGDPSRTGAGSGLGLALAKRIVEALGGSIVVESLPSRGARFALVVPELRP